MKTNTFEEKLRETLSECTVHLPHSKVIDKKVRAITDLVLNDVIPSKRSVPSGELTSVGLQVKYKALGYNQAVKEARAVITNEGKG